MVQRPTEDTKWDCLQDNSLLILHRAGFVSGRAIPAGLWSKIGRKPLIVACITAMPEFLDFLNRFVKTSPRHSSSSAVAAAQRHKTATGAAVLAGLLIAAAALYGVYTLLRHPTTAPFQNFSITRLTSTGKVLNAAISPDGRFLLSVRSDNGNDSLWLRNIPTGSDTQVLPASGRSFASLVFLPTAILSIFERPRAIQQHLIFSALPFSVVHPLCLLRMWMEARCFHWTANTSCIPDITIPS